MNIENSGPVHVFDEKTKQSIEEAKNRLTLLEAETLRLNKLKKTLEGDIIKLEADMAYRNQSLSDLNEKFESLTQNVSAAQGKLDLINDKTKTLERELNLRQNSISEQESELANKLHELQQQMVEVSKIRTELDREVALFSEQKDLFEQRKKTLQSVLDSI